MSNNDFAELGLLDIICQELEKNDIIMPTSVQATSIPNVIKNKDIVCESATGSGKTIAFGTGIIHNIAKADKKQALILAPTRELVEQVCLTLRSYAKKAKVKVCAVYGGVGYQKQIKDMKESQIIVATPGRLLDHAKQRNVDLSYVDTFVLDEADRMLDMGFLPDVKRIIAFLPKKKQLLCFSATYPSEIKRLISKMMVNPIHIQGQKEVDPKKLKQTFYYIEDKNKFSLLVHLLKQKVDGVEMIFCNSRQMVDRLSKSLQKQGIVVVAIHGGLTQYKRKQVLQDFHNKKTRALICTDVAARGLDIPHVTHVFNYDLPDESKQYIHRIGRTARAGKDGVAVSIVSTKDYEKFSRILRIEQVNVQQLDEPKYERVRIESTAREPNKRASFRNSTPKRFGGKKRFGRSDSRGGSRRSNNSKKSRDDSKRSNNSRSSKSSGSRDRHRGSNNSRGSPRSGGFRGRSRS